MGFILISTASAIDIDEASSSSEISDSSIYSGYLATDSDSNSNYLSESNSIEESNASSSNVDSESEVLSTNTNEDTLEPNKGSKNVLSSSSLQASKSKTTLKGSGTSIAKGKSYIVTLTDSNGKALANQKVSFAIKGKTYSRTTDSKGQASLGINLNPGKYTLACSYAATSSYAASSLSVSLTVTKGSTSVKPSGSSIEKGDYYQFTLVDVNGKPLASQKVTISIKGKSYARTTNSQGIASLRINLKAGKYTLSCSYPGTSKYKASSSSVSLTVKNPSSTSQGFSIANIETAAANVKAYVLKNKVLPSTVTVGSSNLKISEFSYLMAKAIANLNSNNKNSIALLSGISNGASSSNSLDTTVYKAQYVDLAKRVYAFIGSNKVPASYATVKNAAGSKVGNAGFNLYTFAFAKILAFHKSDNYLPNYCTFESSAVKASSSDSSTGNVPSSGNSSVAAKATSLKAASTSITRGDVYSVTLTDSSGKALANQKLTISVSGNSYSRTTNSNGIATLNINLVAGKYSIVASYAGSSAYKSSKLTNTVTVKDSSTRFYLNDIENAAANVKTYVTKNKAMPKTVTVANTQLSIAQFSYLMAKAVHNINAGNTNYITLIKIADCNSSGDYLDTTVYKAQYLDMAKRVVSFAESDKVPPVYATVYGTNGKSLGKAEFKLYSFALAKILVFYKSDKYLPNYCTFQSSAIGVSKPIDVSTDVTVNSKIKANSSQFKVGLNEKNTVSDLSAYLKGTGQSAITSTIKDVANKLTKGLSSTASKALAIYNYVRDDISYSYYADSRYGASGTLNAGSGNCVDQASLVVALCRASGIHARYSHAQGCTFSSGLVTGHVWAQILVDGVWYSADATSVRNSLGNIVNWNTRSYYSMKQYAAVPF